MNLNQQQQAEVDTEPTVQEEWKIIEYAKRYAVSNIGRVKRVSGNINTYPGRILNTRPNGAGYIVAQLSCRGNPLANKYGKIWRCVHRLVAESFIGEKPAGYTCNHKDGDKNNNRSDNLEWVTITENNRHALANGLRVMPKGEIAHHVKLRNGEVWLIKKLIKSELVSQRLIAKMFNVCFQTINDIRRWKTWKHIQYP